MRALFAVLLGLALALTGSAATAEIYPAMHRVQDVAADDVLNIRAAPDPSAEVVGTLAPDATGVEVISVTDGWALVNTADGSGYAALRFLRPVGRPDWNQLTEPLSCFGTEPFWSLTIDAASGTMSFATPEPEDAWQGPIGRTWPGAPWSLSAALDLPDGLAVLQPAICSDGMSDWTFGIAIDVFLRNGDRQRLSGCCTLTLR